MPELVHEDEHGAEEGKVEEIHGGGSLYKREREVSTCVDGLHAQLVRARQENG
jgi:hypothetical protein